jgi:hypothetical protein
MSLTSSGQLASWVGLVAVFCALSLSQVHAQETLSSSSPPLQSQSRKSIVIRGEFVETHDFLSDESAPSSSQRTAIEWQHGFTITLSGNNQVAEKWNSARLRVGSKPSPLSAQDQNNVTIGQSSNRVIWHILGEKKLERIFQGQHYLMIMNIEVNASKTCRVEVKYLRQTGFVSVVMKRADNGKMANFSLPSVESASCTIEAT